MIFPSPKSLVPYPLSRVRVPFNRTPPVQTTSCAPDRKTRGRFHSPDLPWRPHSHFDRAISNWNRHSIESRCPLIVLPGVFTPPIAELRHGPEAATTWPRTPGKASMWGSLSELRRLRAAPGEKSEARFGSAFRPSLLPPLPVAYRGVSVWPPGAGPPNRAGEQTGACEIPRAMRIQQLGEPTFAAPTIFARRATVNSTFSGSGEIGQNNPP